MSETETLLRRFGYGLHREAPTRHLDYQQLLVIIGDTTASKIDTLLYVIGASNILRSQSRYVAISASQGGVLTGVERPGHVHHCVPGCARLPESLEALRPQWRDR